MYYFQIFLSFLANIFRLRDIAWNTGVPVVNKGISRFIFADSSVWGDKNKFKTKIKNSFLTNFAHLTNLAYKPKPERLHWRSNSETRIKLWVLGQFWPFVWIFWKWIVRKFYLNHQACDIFMAIWLETRLFS